MSHTAWEIMGWAVFAAFAIGWSIGVKTEGRQCADAQESDDPPKWWKRALIHARAREESRKLDQP